MVKNALRLGLVAAALTAPMVRATPLPQAPRASARPTSTFALTATSHPAVSRDAANLWMAPSAADRTAAASNAALTHLQAGLKAYDLKKYDAALAQFTAAATSKSPLRDYASYYAAVSELRLERFDSARKHFVLLQTARGYLWQAAALGEAEALQGLKDEAGATKVYERLVAGKPIDEPAIWLSLAEAAIASGDRARGAEAYLHLYYEFPTSEFADQAQTPLNTMPEVQPISVGNVRYGLELGRAERLFGLKRINDARASFQKVQQFASGDDQELIGLRLIECDYFQGKFLAAREALKPWMSTGARQAEARFFYLMSQRGLKNYDSFELLTRQLVKDFPDTTWADDAFNHLVTYYLQEKEDDEITAIVREQYQLFPRGRGAERAGWKAGWFAYRAGNMKEAADYFESAAATFPRSDFRPAYLYWSGRARAAMGDKLTAISRFQLELTDYQNSYYGRLAIADLKKLGADVAPTRVLFAPTTKRLDEDGGGFPPNADTIRALLALGLYDPALKELEFAKQNWGDAPALQATVAWTNKQKAAGEKGTAEFNLARGAITLMKRAYPQFLAAGGEQLPRELLTIIYPLSYWDLIRKYSALHDLDPHLVAALMLQESTFVADIKSSANAYGLTQLRPSTAQQYARRLKIKYSRALLTNPEANIKIGTAYFADKIQQFGSVPLALASYNAGEGAVRKWQAANPGLAEDEFIDDIPYPETQGYVKRIVGTADDYRRLYGPG